MSLDKSIKSGKERRKKYRGSASFSYHCRNHNPKRGVQCPACVDNRTFSNRRREESASEQIRDDRTTVRADDS